MSKITDLNTLLAELSAQTQSLLDTVRSIREMFGATEPETEPVPAPKTYTLEEVRAYLLELRKLGFKDELRALLSAHGGERLTDIDPVEYTKLMKDAEELLK